jgi:hypothetical protein
MKIVEKDRLNEFCQIVNAAPDLPKWVRENVDSVRGFDEKLVEQSYLSFLEQQIALQPRGPEWTKVLQRRLESLKNYCGKKLASGIVSEGEKNCFIKLSPESKKILYWELWDFETQEPS